MTGTSLSRLQKQVRTRGKVSGARLAKGLLPRGKALPPVGVAMGVGARLPSRLRLPISSRRLSPADLQQKEAETQPRESPGFWHCQLCLRGKVLSLGVAVDVGACLPGMLRLPSSSRCLLPADLQQEEAAMQSG